MHAVNILSAFATLLLVDGAAVRHNTPTLLPRDGIDPNLGGRYSPLNRPNVNYTRDQLNELKLAYSQVERISLLQSYGDTDDYFKFDFTTVGASSNAGRGEGGYGFLAYAPNYPALLGTGLSMAIGFLQPCKSTGAPKKGRHSLLMHNPGGMDSMHIHNRATEMVILVAGTSLKTGFVMEDGDNTPVLTTIGPFQGTIRPQGSIHYEFNDNCEDAVFIAGLSSEDPGVSRIAQNFFIEDAELIYADLGYPDFISPENLTNFATTIPLAFALGAQACLKRCGIMYNATTNDTASI